MQAACVKDIKYPLTAIQKMAMMRNIEKMITEALNDHNEVIKQYINWLAMITDALNDTLNYRYWLWCIIVMIKMVDMCTLKIV